MTPLAAAQAEVDQVTDIMKDNVGKVRRGGKKSSARSSDSLLDLLPIHPTLTPPSSSHLSSITLSTLDNFNAKIFLRTAVPPPHPP